MTTIKEAVQLMREGRLYSETWQRDWAWSKRHITELLDSAFRNYKIGSTLFWRRQLPGGDFKMVILDGQQRMTTFYTAYYNEIPPIFDRHSPVPPLDLHFNVRSGTFKFPTAAERKRPNLVLVSEIMHNTKALDDMEKQVRPTCTVGEWRKITQNIRRVQNIMDHTLNIEELKPDTAVDDVKQQINRLNRSGKTPTKEDVDLMQLSFVWPGCHEAVNCLIHRWRNSEMEPVVNKATIIRNFAASLTGNVRSKSTEKAFNAVDDVTLKEIYGETASNLEVIGRALEHYFAIGKSTSLRTTAPFVVVMQHLRNQGGEFANQGDELKALAYLITSTIRGFRAGSSSSYLNQELGALNHPDPWAELERQALLRSGPTIVEPSRFEYRDGSPAPHHLLVQILQMLPTSKDWITSQPLRQCRKDELVKHKIFPKNETPTIEAYHSVANTVLLHHMTARCLLNRSPSEYMPTITGRNPSILAGEQIPDDPNLHKPENFEEFCQERMEMLSIDAIEVVNCIQQGTPPDGIIGRPAPRS